jgi:integrase/recombinase XerD
MPNLYILAGMDWEQTLSDYATHQRGANLAEKTIRNREDLLRTVARVTRRGPDDVTQEDLERVLGRTHPRTGERLAAGTMQSERSYMQSFFKWMKKSGRRKGNPAKHLVKVKVPRRRPRPLRRAQIDAILTCGIYKRTRDIIMICALTGLRIGEVVSIRGEDINLDAMTIRSTRKGGLDQVLGLHPMIADLANEYPGEGWWFPSPHRNKQFPNGGGHILMASASDRISKALRAAGITDPKITGHSLRHFFASDLLRQGVPIRVVQEQLGHASLATTQIYTEVTERDMTEGVAVLPGIVRPAHSGRAKPGASARLAA